MSTSDQTRRPKRRLGRDVARSLARSLVLAAGLGFGIVTGTAAQEATTPPATTPAVPAPPTELSMGQEVPSGPAQIATPETAEVGQTYLAASFEVWEQRCIKTKTDRTPASFTSCSRTKAAAPSPR